MKRPGWLKLPRPGRRPAPPVRSPGGDRVFLVVVLAALAVVGANAGSGSWQHQYEQAVRYGQPHWYAGMFPLSVDGLIVAATMVIWYAARRQLRRPWGAWTVLMIAVGATVVFNLAPDYHWRWLGPAISAWPAFAFVAAYEMAVWLVRKRQDARQEEPPDEMPAPPPDTVQAPVPADAQDAALMAMKATAAAGNPLSGRQLETRFGLSRAEATRVRQLVLAGSNGHAPETEEPNPEGTT